MIRSIFPHRHILRSRPHSAFFLALSQVFLCFSSLVVGLASSHGNAGAGSQPEAAYVPPAITLRFVSWKPDHQHVWDEAIARFTKAHPHISVVRELAPHSSTAYHDLLTQKLKNRE